MHNEYLKEIKKDLDALKKEGRMREYEIGEVHLKVVARDIHRSRVERM